MQKLFERAREKGRAAQNIRVRDATVAIEFPLGWLVAIDDQEHVLFLPAHLATPPPDALVREFEQFLESHRADVLRAKDIVVFCMLKPKGSDVHAIKALLERVREQGSSVRAPFRAEVCWLKEFRQDVRRFSHPVIEGLTLTELSTFHLLADDDMARQFQACMEDLDAAGNELKLSNVWRDL